MIFKYTHIVNIYFLLLPSRPRTSRVAERWATHIVNMYIYIYILLVHLSSLPFYSNGWLPVRSPQNHSTQSTIQPSRDHHRITWITIIPYTSIKYHYCKSQKNMVPQTSNTMNSPWTHQETGRPSSSAAGGTPSMEQWESELRRRQQQLEMKEAELRLVTKPAICTIPLTYIYIIYIYIYILTSIHHVGHRKHPVRE